MKVKPKSVKRTVNLLTDPQPTFLSDVDHGANQAPWKTIKSADGNKGSSPDMSTKTQATKQPVVRSVTLSKDVFKTEKSVMDYLAQKDWDPESYEIYDDEGNAEWSVKSTDEYEDGAISKTRCVAAKEAGVFLHIAEIIKEGAQPIDKSAVVETEEGEVETTEKSETDDGDDDEVGQTVTVENLPKSPAAGVKRSAGMKLAKVKRVTPVDQTSANVAKTATKVTTLKYTNAELATKYDWYSAYLSDDTTLVGVLKDGMSYDDLPPGIDTVLDAVWSTTGNILGDASITDKAAALKALGDDFATITMGLYSLFSAAAANIGDETAQKFVETFKTSIIQARKGKKTTDTEVDPENPDADDNKGKTSKNAAPVTVGIAADDVAAIVADAVTKAVAPLRAELTASQAEVAKLSGQTQTKKGLAGVFEDIADQDTIRRQDEATDRSMSIARGLLGARPQQVQRRTRP